jgi:hypothetical protein
VIEGQQSGSGFPLDLPQWDFLNFLSKDGRWYADFHLVMMKTEATGRLERNGKVFGLLCHRRWHHAAYGSVRFASSNRSIEAEPTLRSPRMGAARGYTKIPARASPTLVLPRQWRAPVSLRS